MNTKSTSTERLPPFCPSCDKEGRIWKTVNRDVEQVFRNEHYKVPAEVTECAHCGFRILADAQTDAITRHTADAYRRAHGLLSSREIVARRHAMELSQVEFALWLGVGTASVKRWELALVQEKASDLLMRERTAHTVYHDDIYRLTEPTVENHAFECAAGFTKWVEKTWVTVTGPLNLQAAAQYTFNYTKQHALTITA